MISIQQSGGGGGARRRGRRFRERPTFLLQNSEQKRPKGAPFRVQTHIPVPRFATTRMKRSRGKPALSQLFPQRLKFPISVAPTWPRRFIVFSLEVVGRRCRPVLCRPAISAMSSPRTPCRFTPTFTSGANQARLDSPIGL